MNPLKRDPWSQPPVKAEYEPYGGGPVIRRTPTQMREAVERRVSKWFAAVWKSTPETMPREERIATAFGPRGWVVRARIASPQARWPMHGWLLSHAENGLIVFADKPRDGDKGPDYTAPRGGGFGQQKCWWGGDLPHLLLHATPDGAFVEPDGSPRPQATRMRYPHHYVAQVLAAHAYTIASTREQQDAAMLLALQGRNLACLLADYEAREPDEPPILAPSPRR